MRPRAVSPDTAARSPTDRSCRSCRMPPDARDRRSLRRRNHLDGGAWIANPSLRRSGSIDTIPRAATCRACRESLGVGCGTAGHGGVRSPGISDAPVQCPCTTLCRARTCRRGDAHDVRHAMPTTWRHAGDAGRARGKFPVDRDAIWSRSVTSHHGCCGMQGKYCVHARNILTCRICRGYFCALFTSSGTCCTTSTSKMRESISTYLADSLVAFTMRPFEGARMRAREGGKWSTP